jgi:hypothetical protein
MDNIDAFDVLLKGDLSKGPIDDLTDDELEVISKKNVQDKDDSIEDKDIKKDDDLSDTDDLKKDDSSVSDDDDLGEYEEQISTFVKSKLENKLGISLGKHTKIEDIVDELAEIVEESSSASFANEEVAKLNEFVANGGDLKKFYSTVYSGGIDLDNIDIDNVSDQKRIIREDLKNNGYSDTQIERKISRYEDSGVLQEEAEDATDRLKEYRTVKEKELLETAKKEAEQVRKRNEMFVSDVQKGIKELNNVFGIDVSEKQKKELYSALLIPESDGKTKFQKEYSKDIKNLLMSAFVVMYGQDLIKKAQNKGASNVAKDLKDKLSQKGNRLKKTVGQDDEVDALSYFASKLRKN